MSRNLCQQNCYFCEGEVVRAGPDRVVSRADCGAYIDEYEGLIVADAQCEDCEAQYLGWVDERRRTFRQDIRGFTYVPDRHGTEDYPFCDLSFRSTFDDEPGVADLPRYDVKRQRCELTVCEKCGKTHASIVSCGWLR